MRIGEAVTGMGKWLGLGPAPKPVEQDPMMSQVAQSVVDFRQRIAEDPEYVRSFIDSVLQETRRREALDAEASRELLDDDEWEPLPDEVHALVGETVRTAMEALTNPMIVVGDNQNEVLSPDEQIAREFFERIGYAIVKAYEAGLAQCPPILQQEGVFGHYFPGVGTLVVRERILGIEPEIDALITADRKRLVEGETK